MEQEEEEEEEEEEGRGSNHFPAPLRPHKPI
jgi:hypothetical protein